MNSVNSASSDSDSGLHSAPVKMISAPKKKNITQASLRERLILFVKLNYHYIVEDMHSMVNDFLNANLDLKKKIEYHIVLSEAIKLSERGWKL